MGKAICSKGRLKIDPGAVVGGGLIGAALLFERRA